MKARSPTADRPSAPQPDLPDEAYDWLYAIVTEEAKQDPDWRTKARTGRGNIRGDLASPPKAPQSS